MQEDYSAKTPVNVQKMGQEILEYANALLGVQSASQYIQSNICRVHRVDNSSKNKLIRYHSSAVRQC